MHNHPIKKIVIVGGGSAGWLTAGIIAAEHLTDNVSGIQVTLIESPDVATIGVGEGTWPSMRNTLKKIGLSETTFIRECDVSFKQGSKFTNWINEADNSYYHPFTLPEGFSDINLAAYWLAHKDEVTFADAVCVQRYVSDAYLAPKLISTAEFAGNINYGYHLNAGKFAMLLKKHCIEVLGVNLILDHVHRINTTEQGDISSLSTKENGDISADLFVDCSGSTSLLIGEHYQIPLIEKRDILFNDCALAVQVPYVDSDGPIASCTVSTAQKMGWVWDIGLPTRRGVGHVYSSAHTTDEAVELSLKKYLAQSIGAAEAEKITPRKLTFVPGHREVFWHRNCVAVGMAAGFIEPLEATALVLIELSAQMIAEQLPANRIVMDIIAKRFNKTFTANWQRIVEFLKLHYVLSARRDSDYWLDHQRQETIPESLQEQLALWRHHVPWKQDIRGDEMFPWASYQYILYGMGFETEPRHTVLRNEQKMKELANKLFADNQKKIQASVQNLPTTRSLLKKVQEFGFQKI